MRKGYVTNSGYMGWIEQEKRYRLFDTEGEYRDYISDLDFIRAERKNEPQWK